MFLFGIFFGGDCMAWHVQSGPFRVLSRKSTPDGKKYASGAGDKLQLCEKTPPKAIKWVRAPIPNLRKEKVHSFAIFFTGGLPKPHLTLQLSGLVGASAAMGRRGSMSKVGFQAELYGLNQTMPRSGATNDDCLIRIMAKSQGVMDMFAWCCLSVGNQQL